MKRVASLLALAVFAVVAPVHAQNAATDMNIGTIKRPTPKPEASAGTTAPAKATGPTEFALYKDAAGKSASTTFSPTDPVYIKGKDVTAAKGDKMVVTWFDDKGGKHKKIYASSSAAPDAGSFNPSFNLAPAKGGTPAGDYHVEFALNGKVVKSLPFTVK